MKPISSKKISDNFAVISEDEEGELKEEPLQNFDLNRQVAESQKDMRIQALSDSFGKY